MSKVRIWEEPQLNVALKHAIQIRENIERLAVDSKSRLEDLPQSLVPSAMLYTLVAYFYVLYKDALDRDLLETGTDPATLKNNIH